MGEAAPAESLDVGAATPKSFFFGGGGGRGGSALPAKEGLASQKGIKRRESL